MGSGFGASVALVIAVRIRNAVVARRQSSSVEDSWGRGCFPVSFDGVRRGRGVQVCPDPRPQTAKMWKPRPLPLRQTDFSLSVSSSPSQRDTTIVATPLPMKFVIARASDMKRSMPRISARPATGTDGTTASVAASVMNPAPVTPDAPLRRERRHAQQRQSAASTSARCSAPARRRSPPSSDRCSCRRG